MVQLPNIPLWELELRCRQSYNFKSVPYRERGQCCFASDREPFLVLRHGLTCSAAADIVEGAEEQQIRILAHAPLEGILLWILDRRFRANGVNELDFFRTPDRRITFQPFVYHGHKMVVRSVDFGHIGPRSTLRCLLQRLLP
ncbi:hypothetical protein KC320_g174 [Hortaea werneckii]|nr:hypothetical protein KC320_g174 [Hortaea werneckii]